MPDPKLDLGIEYVGGIKKPEPQWANWQTWVNPEGDNLEYYPAFGATIQRPPSPPLGFVYYDTDLSARVQWLGSEWETLLDFAITVPVSGPYRAWAAPGNSLDFYLAGGDTLPSEAPLGDTFFETTEGALKVWDGDEWRDVGPVPYTPASGSAGGFLAVSSSEDGYVAQRLAGSTAQRPAGGTPDANAIYFDTQVQKWMSRASGSWVAVDTLPLPDGSNGSLLPFVNTGGTAYELKRTFGTTAQRPTGVAAGFLYYNTTLEQVERWTGSVWAGILPIHARDFTVTTGAPPGGPFTSNQIFIRTDVSGEFPIVYPGAVAGATRIFYIPANQITSISGSAAIDPTGDTFDNFDPTKPYVVIMSRLGPFLITTGRVVHEV
jgi:hypothetical protein